MQSNSRPNSVAPEATALKRRVLAHERVPQALMACMVRPEPPLVDRSRETIVEPMRMLSHEKAHLVIVLAARSS